jgi:hypothetical protein
MAIFVSVRFIEEDVYFVNHNLPVIDELYEFYQEESWLGLWQANWHEADNKDINVKWTLENHPFNWASRLTVFCYTWWIMILFSNKLWNYLIARGWNIPRIRKEYDLGKQWCTQSHGILSDFTLSTPFQKTNI